MVECRWRFRVAESVQVPVNVRAEHDGSLLGKRECRHLEVPLEGSQSISHVRDDISGEALLAIVVKDGERDRVSRVRDNGPIAPVPSPC